MSVRFFVIAVLLCATANVKSQWNTCDDEHFCSRIRNQDPSPSPYVLDRQSITVNHLQASLEANLINTVSQKPFKLCFVAYPDGIIRVTIEDPEQRRHSVPEALDIERTSSFFVNYDGDGLAHTFGTGNTSVAFDFEPFRLEVYEHGTLVNVINQQGRLTYNTEAEDQSIALDFSFPEAVRAYGIPEHADWLSLQSTAPGGRNPYRLYNVDYPAYPIGTQEALYGAVAVLYAHGTQRTTGVFWLNSAQTFVDVNNAPSHVDAFFITESGALDFFVLPGPTLESAVRQYTNLTGATPLPQYFALGHHQCRWSYMSQEDAETVVREFDNHNLPLDVIWLDIDYTDSFKYFTWDYEAFPEPVAMQEFFNSTGRKMVAIIDPHYKVEVGYFVFDIATANGYFVKYPNGTDYQGMCWPGLSSYLDYHHPEGAAWYSSLFAMDEFPDGTDILYIWNDMNEPSVFDVFEKTMPRDLVHYGGWQHRDVHNMYGFTQTVATHNGLLLRYEEKKRPFVLTRSFFAGSQRYSAVWTGDNVASWEHLRISFPMLLTLSLSGITFSGADVGGFDGNPEEELLVRWYQAGAWLPFYRAHSSMYTERREPYLFSQVIQTRIRRALRQRYDHLLVWYTLFFEHQRYLTPVIRPLSYQYSSDPNTLDMDDQWLVGSNILVHPVTQPGATQVTVYLPGGFGEYWYDIENNLFYVGAGFTTVAVDSDHIPVFYRGGSFVIKQNTVGLSSVPIRFEPVDMYIFLDGNEQANGTYYFDDGESFNYRNKVYNYYRFYFGDNALYASVIDEDASYPFPIWIRVILVYRPPSGLRTAFVNSENGERETHVAYSIDGNYLKVNVDAVIGRDFKMRFNQP